MNRKGLKMTTKSSSLFRGKFRNVFSSKRSRTRHKSSTQSVRLESMPFQKISSDIGNKSISSEESLEGMIDRYYSYTEDDVNDEYIEVTKDGTTLGPKQVAPYHTYNDWDQNSLIERPKKSKFTETNINTGEVSSSGRSKLAEDRSPHQPQFLVQRRSSPRIYGCCDASDGEESEESSVETLDVLMAHFKCGDSGIDVAIEDWDLPKCRAGESSPVVDESTWAFQGVEVVSAYGD